MYKLYRTTPLRPFTPCLEGLSSIICKRLHFPAPTLHFLACSIGISWRIMLRGRAHGPFQVSPALVMIVAALVCGTAGELLGAQAERKMSEGRSSSARIEQGVDLAAKGKCPEALAILRKSIPAPVDKQLRYRAAMASAQCGMSVDQADVVVESLLLLNREFPDDSKVLYITSRYYSELANRAARKLTVKAPSSAEAQVLMA